MYVRIYLMSEVTWLYPTIVFEKSRASDDSAHRQRTENWREVSDLSAHKPMRGEKSLLQCLRQMLGAKLLYYHCKTLEQIIEYYLAYLSIRADFGICRFLLRARFKGGYRNFVLVVQKSVSKITLYFGLATMTRGKKNFFFMLNLTDHELIMPNKNKLLAF